MFVLLQVKETKNQALRFGVLNLVAIFTIFGFSAFVTLFGYSILLWLNLIVIVKIKKSRFHKFSSLSGILLIVLLAGLFISYKKFFDALVLGNLDTSNLSGFDTVFRFISTISFSYVFIRTIDLVRSITWGSSWLSDPVSLAGYLGPFHMLVAGPLSSYQDHLEINKQPPPDPTIRHIIRCSGIITTGLFFKIVIAQSIFVIRFGVDGSFIVTDWLDACLLFLYLYFDFGGYSIIALGVGRLMGVPTPINFHKPFLSRSVTEFWTRWHVSLGMFIRNNIYWPIQFWLARKVRNPKIAELLSLASMCAGFSAVAIWHRFTPRFFIWGLATSLIMLVEKYLRDWLLSRQDSTRHHINTVMVILGPVYTMTVIVLTIWYLSFELANL